MLRSAKPVIQQVLATYPKGGTDIATIARLIASVTAIDRINYVGYDVPKTNPILGSFQRFEKQEAVYADFVTVVEVRYALHLDDVMKRFVVYKELCHALEAPDGKHSVSEQGFDDLVTAFSLMSADEEPDFDLHSITVEVLALCTAIEIICPLPRRQHLVQKFAGNLDLGKVSDDYGIPSFLCDSCFKPKYLRSMEKIYKQYELV